MFKGYLFVIILTFALISFSTFIMSAPSGPAIIMQACEVDVDCPEGQLCNQTIHACQQNQTDYQNSQYIVTPPLDGHTTQTGYRSCVDSDDGLNYDVKGNVTYDVMSSGTIRTSWDSCVDDVLLQEYYCNIGFSYSKGFYCSDEDKVCKNGACVPACKDSDPGNSRYVKGVVTYGDTFFEDFCNSEDAVVKYYCGFGIGTPTSDLYLCNYSSGEKCDDGRCVISSSSPDSDHKLNILPNVKVPSSAISLVFGDDFGHAYQNHFVYNSVDPIVYYKPIKEYIDEEYYPPGDWRIITEYDDRMCLVNVEDSDPTHKLTANFKLEGITADGKTEEIEKDGRCVSTGQGKWNCYAKFPSPKDLRTLKYTCSVTVNDNVGNSIKATSKPTIVANYVFPAIRVELNEFPPSLTRNYDTFRKISELEDTPEESIQFPILSGKIIYYDVNVPVSIEKINHNYLLFNIFNLNFYRKIVDGLGINFDPNKRDNLIIVSDKVLDEASLWIGDNSKLQGFAPLNYVAYIRSDIDDNTLAHELGHSEGIHLCDEYSRLFYTLQNIVLLPSGGCPNKFPANAELREKIAKRLDGRVIRLIKTGFTGDLELPSMKTTLLYELKDTVCKVEGRQFSTPEICEGEIERRALQEFSGIIKRVYVTVTVPGEPIIIDYTLDNSVAETVMTSSGDGRVYPSVDASHPLHKFYCPLKDCG